MTDKQKYILRYLVTFLIGIGAGLLLCTYKPRITDKDVLIKRDTIERKVYVSYDKAELLQGTKTLDIPQIKSFIPTLLVPKDSVRIEYRDTGKIKTEYIVLPRKAYHTHMKDIDIYHSGVDSQIDSVSFSYTNTTITELYKRRDWKNEVSIYGMIGYDKGFSIPVGVEYAYYPKRWVGFGVRAEYDFLLHKTSILATANFRFGW